MATWIPTENEIGLQPIATTSTTQNHALGKVIRAKDNDTSGQGAAEFIYLLGVVNTVVGSIVKYNATTYQTVLLANTAGQAVPVAVAMSANVASQYGWYQIGGNAVIKKTAVKFTPQVAVFISATAGRVKSTATTGLAVLGARSANLTTVTTTTSTVTVTLDRPHAQGQII